MKTTVLGCGVACGLLASILVGHSVSEEPVPPGEAEVQPAAGRDSAFLPGAGRDAPVQNPREADKLRRQLVVLYEQSIRNMHEQDLQELLARTKRRQVLRLQNHVAHREKQMLQEVEQRLQLQIQVLQRQKQLVPAQVENLQQIRARREAVQAAIEKNRLADEKLQLVQKLLRRIAADYRGTSAATQADQMLQAPEGGNAGGQGVGFF